MEKPPFAFPLEDGKQCVHHKEGRYYVSLDRNSALEFLFSLHWFITDAPMGEEISFWSRDCGELPCLGEEIGYCELNLMPEHNPRRKHNDPRRKPHGEYDSENKRLNYFVNVAECTDAYEALFALLSETENYHKIREVTIFDTLTLKLVD